MPVFSFWSHLLGARTTPARKAERGRPAPSGVGSRSSAARTLRRRRKPHVGLPIFGGREPRPHEKPSGAAPALSGVGSRSSAARTLRQRRKTPVGYPYLGGENHARTKNRAEPPYPVGRRFAFERSENFAPTAQDPPWGARREPRPHEKPSGAAPALSGVGSRSSAARTLRPARLLPRGAQT